MRDINWYGNDGRCNPAPGTLEAAECGVCGAQMNVKRNILSATSFAESMAGKKHRHDSFICPSINEGWHKRIYHLKMCVYHAEIDNTFDYEQKKEAAEKEILAILETHHTVR